MRAGEMIKAAREAAGLRREELVVRAGISLRSLQALETGAHSPQATTLALICDALELPPEVRGAMLTASAWTEEG